MPYEFSWAICLKMTDRISLEVKIKLATYPDKLFGNWICLNCRIYVSDSQDICGFKI